VLTSATSNRYPDLARPISSAEFQNALAEARSAGLHRFDHRHSWSVGRTFHIPEGRVPRVSLFPFRKDTLQHM